MVFLNYLNYMEKVRKIGIDARFFGSLDKGFGRYVENLILNLEITDKENLYFIFLNEKRDNAYVPHNINFKKILIKHNSLWPFLVDNKIYKEQLDIIHFTCLPFPIFYKTRARTVLSIHDLTWKLYPLHKFVPKKIIYNTAFYHAIKTTDKIIANSEYTKNDILKHYKINPQKIKVIHEGIN